MITVRQALATPRMAHRLLVQRRPTRWFHGLYWWDGWHLRRITSWPHIPFGTFVRLAMGRARPKIVANVTRTNALLAYLQGRA